MLLNIINSGVIGEFFLLLATNCDALMSNTCEINPKLPQKLLLLASVFMAFDEVKYCSH